MRTPPNLSYVICTTVRSGSWMLCSALTQTRIAGRPAEYFGQTLWEELMNNRSQLGLNDVRDFMLRVMDVSTTDNGIFGTKLVANHSGTFTRRASEHTGRPFASLYQALEATFPNLRHVFLMRGNKVAQAISLYRAIMSGTWLHDERNGPLNQVQSTELVYDHFAIQRCYQDLMASDAYWERYFETHSISPIRITYEDLFTDYEKTMRRLLRELGLPWHIDIERPTTVKLSNEQSADWEKEFRRTGRIPEPEPGLAPETFWGPY